MKYIVIAYDKRSATVYLLGDGEETKPYPLTSLRGDILCQGTSMSDIVKSLETAFQTEMEKQ